MIAPGCNSCKVIDEKIKNMKIKLLSNNKNILLKKLVFTKPIDVNELNSEKLDL